MQRERSRLLIEVGFILVSVGVGFGLARLGDYWSDRALAEEALINLREEVEASASALDSLLVKHRAWQAALSQPGNSAAGENAFMTLFATRPDSAATIGVPLRAVAWNTAVSTGALRLLDYDVASALSEIYAYQALMTENHNRFTSAALYAPATFDPAQRDIAVRLLQGVMSEIVGNEGHLLTLYQKHLPLLRERAAK
jgi:hypothetical protein